MTAQTPQSMTSAWPDGYSEASQAIAAEAVTDPHDPGLYWSFFLGTD